MKLKYFSQQTLPKVMGGGNRAARVSFAKSGTITFNEPATQLMGLKVGDKVSLSQDEEDPVNWYFFKDKEHGFEVRSAYDKKGCMFNHSKMVSAFITAVELEEGITHSLLIAGKPTTIKGDKAQTQYWGILVKS